MVATPSTMLPLGTEAPAFSLPNVTDGSTVSLHDFPDAKAYLVAVLCNHCPYVVHLRDSFASLGNEALDRGTAVFAISANDVDNYPADAPELMAKEAREAGYRFPYLYDETQETAKAYKAACTPDFFLFGADRKLAYRGQYDDSRPGSDYPASGTDLRAALDHVLARRSVPEPHKPSLGCNVKWKPGNAPEYFG